MIARLQSASAATLRGGFNMKEPLWRTVSFSVVLTMAAVGCQPGGGSGSGGPAPAAPVVYAATGNGLFISNDDFSSSVQRTTADGLGHDEVFAVCASGTNVYAGTHYGLSISTDSGAHFTTPFIPAGDKSVHGVFAAGGKIYAACASDGLWVSANGGTTFGELGASVIGGGLTSVNAVFVTADTIYAATNKGLYTSPTTSDAFTKIVDLADRHVLSVCVSGLNIWVAADFDGLYTSLDGGANWDNPVVVSPGDEATSVCRAETAGVTYLGSTGGLWVSAGGGLYSKKTTTDGLASNAVYGVCVSGSGTYSDEVCVATYDGISLGNIPAGPFGSSLRSNTVHGVYAQ